MLLRVAVAVDEASLKDQDFTDLWLRPEDILYLRKNKDWDHAYISLKGRDADFWLHFAFIPKVRLAIEGRQEFPTVAA